MKSVAFVQQHVSQLDELFYVQLNALLPGRVSVVYYNDHGFARQKPDPELGVVPEFPPLEGEYPRAWVDSRKTGLVQLARIAVGLQPRVAVLSDLPGVARLCLAQVLRLAGVTVGLRSDKNRISDRGRSGSALLLERIFIRAAYGFLVPVSPLTIEYYNQPKSLGGLALPYCSATKKFARPSRYRQIRDARRELLGIPEGATVFLAVTKFVERENPWGVVQAFRSLLVDRPGCWLLVIGAGPQFTQISEYVREENLPNVRLLGYVPHGALEDYFFASDVLVHLAHSEPWGVSAQDALLGGLGLVASDHVGAAVELLKGELSRFLVPTNQPHLAALRMKELADSNSISTLFAAAQKRVLNSYTVESVAQSWASFVR